MASHGRRSTGLPPESNPARLRRSHLAVPADSHARIHAAVRRIPRGRVATYGQVAVAAGLPGRARLVGYALHALPEHTAVPWHRVINAEGRISLRRGGAGEVTQRLLLEGEGVRFDAAGRIRLAEFGWRDGGEVREAPQPPREGNGRSSAARAANDSVQLP